MKNKLIAQTFLAISMLTTPIFANAALSMVCYVGPVSGFPQETLACNFGWSNTDELGYFTGVVNYTLTGTTHLGTAIVTDTYVFVPTTKPNNRLITYVNYFPSGAGTYVLDTNGTLFSLLGDESGIYYDYHPDGTKQDVKGAALPVP